jgi:Protein of unknown function (DUF3105)
MPLLPLLAVPDKPRVKAPKPRVKAPRQREVGDSGGNRRLVMIGASVLGVVVVAGALAGLLAFRGGGGGSVRSKLAAAGCTLQVAPANHGNAHTITNPNKTPKNPADWNTDPPTNGPHFAVPAVFGQYDQPLQMARLVHNLEHGGIYILYGSDVPAATVDRLRSFYGSHQDGTVLAPLPRLGHKIALGAWVATDQELSQHKLGHGYLAKCTTFDDSAYSAFLHAYQFQGVQRFLPSQLEPGM